MPWKLALVGGLTATLFMVGVIVFVRVVHYPLFAQVGRAEFPSHHAEHVRRTTLVVLVPMTVELILAAALLVWRPPGASRSLASLGLAAAMVAWGVTALVSVPSHETLARGFDPSAQRALLRGDLARVAAWVGHAIILLAMTWRALPDGRPPGTS